MAYCTGCVQTGRIQFCVVCSQEVSNWYGDAYPWELFIRFTSNSTFTLRVNPNETLGSSIERYLLLSKQTAWRLDDIWTAYSGRILSMEHTIEDCRLESGVMLHLVGRLRGD